MKQREMTQTPITYWLLLWNSTKPTVAWDRCWLFSMDRQTTNRLFGLGCDCGFTPRARLVGSSGRGVGQGADQMISGMVIKLNLIFVCMEWQTQSDSLYWQAYWI